MSCWVVPALAAELWGISLQQVLKGIKEGTIPSREEHGFTFVQTGEEAQPIIAPVQMRPADRPSTFIMSHSDDKIEDTSDESEDVVTQEEHDALVLPDWRQVRRAVGRTRVPPKMAA
jgi:hypothetical protein